MNKRYIVGIDVSKKWLDLVLRDRQSTLRSRQRVPNSAKGFRQLGQWLENQQLHKSNILLLSEHTGRYGERLLRWSTEHSWSHTVVKTTALGKVAPAHHRKTDAFDAQLLAEYGDRFYDRLHLVQAPEWALAQLKRLQAERRKMVDRRAALKGKLTEASTHDADMDQLVEMWNQQVGLLTDHITELEDHINTLLANDPVLQRQSAIMGTAPGMGKVLTPLWVSLFAHQQTLHAPKICSRFGFAPHPHESGSSVGGLHRSSGFGNSEMRRVMHQAAMSVKTHYPHYANYYERKRAEGKPHLLVINNIINKLIRMYCAMWNQNTPYDPDYIEKHKEQWKKSA